MKYVNIHRHLDDFIKREKIEESTHSRDSKISELLKYKNFNQYEIFGYKIYISEKLGHNSSLSEYIDFIVDKIKNRKKDSFSFNLDIEQLSISKIDIILNSEETSIEKNENKLQIKIEYDKLERLRSTIDHELHHIFMISKGFKTNNKYFLINDLIKKTSGKTQAFLILWYLAFPDELNSNIQMLHSEIGENDIKNKQQFSKFLNNHNLWKIAQKMKNIDIFKYWSEICKEENDNLLIDKLDIQNINKFLEQTSDFIINAGNDYIRKMSRIFI